jgi:hypothetical protein
LALKITCGDKANSLKRLKCFGQPQVSEVWLRNIGAEENQREEKSNTCLSELRTRRNKLEATDSGKSRELKAHICHST